MFDSEMKAKNGRVKVIIARKNWKQSCTSNYQRRERERERERRNK